MLFWKEEGKKGRRREGNGGEGRGGKEGVRGIIEFQKPQRDLAMIFKMSIWFDNQSLVTLGEFQGNDRSES